MVAWALGTTASQESLWLQSPPYAPDPLTRGAPDHWRIRDTQEYWQRMMDVVLKIRGPRGGQWTSMCTWTHTEETLYNEWNRTVEKSHTADWDIDKLKYELLRWKAVEEAIWEEEIRLQDDASDAMWLDKLLRQTTASYELRLRDYTTWFANYKRRKATEQYRLDREH